MKTRISMHKIFLAYEMRNEKEQKVAEITSDLDFNFDSVMWNYNLIFRTSFSPILHARKREKRGKKCLMGQKKYSMGQKKHFMGKKKYFIF